MADRPVSVRYDPSTGALVVETGGPTITVDELGDAVSFIRADDDDERHAFFVTRPEADVLLKMVNYILDKVKVTEASRNHLQAVKPRLEALLSALGE